MLRRAYDAAFAQVLAVTEKDVVPDFLLRAGMRHLLGQRAKETSPASSEEFYRRLQAFRDELAGMPVAVQTAAANEQHYEVPTEYFLAVLGPHRKYSSCLYERPDSTLAEAEEAMLALSCRRAQLEDGQDVKAAHAAAAAAAAATPALGGCCASFCSCLPFSALPMLTGPAPFHPPAPNQPRALLCPPLDSLLPPPSS